MQVTEQEIEDMRSLIRQLDLELDSAVVVEGKRDVAALRRIGYFGKILEFHRFGGMTDFADCAATYKNIIILYDRDRKGRYLTKRTVRLLQRRTNINLSYKKRLQRITKGKMTFVEQLVCYEPYLERFAVR